MKVLLLSAGLGTRLRPITNNTPKCLVPVYGKPLLQIWLESLSKIGLNSFLVNTHYLSKQVKDFIKKGDFSIRVKIVYEAELLGTAGTLINNVNFFDEDDVIIIHADNYCLADFNAFIEAHARRPKECEMTMMTFRTDNPSSCGIVKINNNGVVTDFIEKPGNPTSNLANAAIYIVSHSFIKECVFKFKNVSDFSTELIPKFLNRIYTHETDKVMIDIGTIENYKKLQ